jgi:hypothetical protein
VIDANLGPILLLQIAFYAVKLEVQRRRATCCFPRSVAPKRNDIDAE